MANKQINTLTKMLNTIDATDFTKDDFNDLRLIEYFANKVAKKAINRIKTIKRKIDLQSLEKYDVDDRFIMRFIDDKGIVKYFGSCRANPDGGVADINDASVFVGYRTAMGFREDSYIQDIDIIPDPRITKT